jgi:hypothetical protein
VYPPCPSDVAVSDCPVALFRTVTLAFGTTAPDESTIVPAIDDVVFCPHAGAMLIPAIIAAQINDAMPVRILNLAA